MSISCGLNVADFRHASFAVYVALGRGFNLGGTLCACGQFCLCRGLSSGVLGIIVTSRMPFNSTVNGVEYEGLDGRKPVQDAGCL